MTNLEYAAYELYEKHGKASPTLLCFKLKITFKRASELHTYCIKRHANLYKNYRTSEEYEKSLLQENLTKKA